MDFLGFRVFFRHIKKTCPAFINIALREAGKTQTLVRQNAELSIKKSLKAPARGRHKKHRRAKQK